jgi:hypothetical protein
VRLSITVQASDLEFADPGDAWGCLVVRAFYRKYPQYRRVFVDVNRIAFSDMGTNLRYFMVTPDKAKPYIKAFDDNQEFPGDLTFYLDTETAWDVREIGTARPPRRPGDKKPVPRAQPAEGKTPRGKTKRQMEFEGDNPESA